MIPGAKGVWTKKPVRAAEGAGKAPNSIPMKQQPIEASHATILRLSAVSAGMLKGRRIQTAWRCAHDQSPVVERM